MLKLKQLFWKVFAPVSMKANAQNKRYQPTAYTGEQGKNSIHFLDVEYGDCIVLASGGHIAVVDCAEDGDNPRGFPNLVFRGDEENICRYLKDNFSDEKGNLYIDFIVGTHSHSDHLGGFDTLLLDPQVTVGKAYLKRYLASTIREYERRMWDNQEVYDQTVHALAERNVELIQDIPERVTLGEAEITFYNTEYDYRSRLGENDNSLVMLLTCCGKKILLMGDADNNSGDEVGIAKQVGKVDLLKVGHHGYKGSTTKSFIKTVRPTVSIVTNKSKRMSNAVRRNILQSGSALYAVRDEQGMIAVFRENEDIKLYNHHSVL